MESQLQERFEEFAKALDEEFELQIEVYGSIIKDGTRPSDIMIKNLKDAFMESFKSLGNGVSKCVSGLVDSLSAQRNKDIAGKLSNLVNKYKNPEEKKVIRAMLVRVSFELFRSYEYQFMKAEKSHGGWAQAMVELARSAIWCFMHYYKFNPQENLTEKYILEGITFKDMPDVSYLKKRYLKEEENSTKVTNIETQVKYHGTKMYSKSGIVLEEYQGLVYYKSDLANPKKYNFRRIFSHENKESIKTVLKVEDTSSAPDYQYLLDRGTATKENMCKKILEKINNMDDSLLEARLSENMKRIFENIVADLMCEMKEQIAAILNGIQMPAVTSTTTVNNKNTINRDMVCQEQKADSIFNFLKNDVKEMNIKK